MIAVIQVLDVQLALEIEVVGAFLPPPVCVCVSLKVNLIRDNFASLPPRHVGLTFTNLLSECLWIISLKWVLIIQSEAEKIADRAVNKSIYIYRSDSVIANTIRTPAAVNAREPRFALE